jgi:hypothetical protein
MPTGTLNRIPANEYMARSKFIRRVVGDKTFCGTNSPTARIRNEGDKMKAKTLRNILLVLGLAIVAYITLPFGLATFNKANPFIMGLPLTEFVIIAANFVCAVILAVVYVLDEKGGSPE